MEEGDLQCDHCKTVFANKHNLTKHMKRKTKCSFSGLSEIQHKEKGLHLRSDSSLLGFQGGLHIMQLENMSQVSENKNVYIGNITNNHVITNNNINLITKIDFTGLFPDYR